jgi:hypothetical protein
MGGQACVLYGAAEFSRDTDLAILASPPNLTRLGAALVDLQAEVIAGPPFELQYLQRRHAIHFRCHAALLFVAHEVSVMRQINRCASE